MARRLRDDAPGRWHHLTNRGLAKRTMFEGERDFRMFLALVAKEVRAGRLDDDFRNMIERELGLRIPQDEEDTTIRHTLSARTVRWAFRKAKLSDGTRPFRRISPARLVETAVALWIKQVGPLLGYFKHPLRDAWTNLNAGLLRTLSGCTQREIGLRNGRHNSSVCRDLQEHRALLKHAPDYENLHAKIANDVIETIRVTARAAAR